MAKERQNLKSRQGEQAEGENGAPIGMKSITARPAQEVPTAR